MRLVRLMVVSALFLGISTSAWTQTANFSGTPEQLSQVRYSQTSLLLEKLVEAKAASNDANKSAWFDALGTIYASMTGSAIWTDDDGYTPRAQSLIEELRLADDWGLRASDFRVADFSSRELTADVLAQMDIDLSLAILKYSWHAQGGRIEPTELSLWLDRSIRPMDGVETLKSIATAPNPRLALIGVHPQHPEFERLRQAYLALRKPQKPKKFSREDIRVPSRGSRIKPGRKHPHVAIIRRRLGVPLVGGDADVYDADLVAHVNKFMRTQGWKRKRTIDNRVRAALNSPKGKKRKKFSKTSTRDLLLVNMEKWRWMPVELGTFHIWNNLPSFRTNVVKADRVIHSERIIIGKTSTQTPIFSDEMTHVVFKPEWGVPSSIKIRSLLPRLASGDYGVLARRGMSIKYDNGVVKSPSRINWARTDIRSVPIVMGPGSSNPLGRVKFIFPNEHAVYMHDTPKKHLFKSRTRTFSHGCIRVRDPVRLAEVVLAESVDWDSEQVADKLARRAPGNNKIPLPEPIPVHNVYFTVEEDASSGKLARLADIYGHDKRILAALNGKPAALIAKSDPARAYQKRNEQLAKSPPIYRRPDPYAVALGEGFNTAPPGFYWGKPKKWKPWKASKPPKFAKKKRWKRNAPRRRAFQLNAYQGHY